MSGAGGARQGILSLVVKDKAALYNAYMPYIRQGGIFVPTTRRYFIGDEVYNRIATDEFGRHGEWYGWLQVYAPTLLLGTMPWTPALLRWARGLPADLRRWPTLTWRAARAPPSTTAHSRT